MTITSPAVDGAARIVEYRLLPQSTVVAFTARHLFGLGAVSGTVRLLAGRMLADTSSGRLVSLEAELDMTSFDSSSRARDRAVLSSRFLDVGAHPTATYRAARAERTGSGWLVRGDLTVKGLTAPVDLVVADLDPATALRAHVTASVDRFAYGMRFPAAFASRRLGIAIDVRAERGAEAAAVMETPRGASSDRTAAAPESGVRA